MIRLIQYAWGGLYKTLPFPCIIDILFIPSFDLKKKKLQSRPISQITIFVVVITATEKATSVVWTWARQYFPTNPGLYLKYIWICWPAFWRRASSAPSLIIFTFPYKCMNLILCDIRFQISKSNLLFSNIQLCLLNLQEQIFSATLGHWKRGVKKLRCQFFSWYGELFSEQFLFLHIP